MDVTAGAVVEVEGSYQHQDGNDESALKLSTFELGLDAKLMPGVSGAASLLWEEDDTEPVDLDTAFINLGGMERIPVTFSAGRMYLPFGSYNSLMVSDPLPLELGETRETVRLEYAHGLFSVWAGGFAGEINNANRME